MYCRRIMSKLEIKGRNLVKGRQFEGIRALGSPEAFAGKYYEDGVDELVYVDIVAALYGRNSLGSVINAIASEVFIPMTVAGGLRTLEDIEQALNAGADSKGLNTSAGEDPGLIEAGAKRFGSQCILVMVDAKALGQERYEVYVEGGRQPTGRDVFDWLGEVEGRGAGEVVLTSIDQDGIQAGFDLGLVRRAAQALHIPLIAAGGAGCYEDVARVFLEGQADAVAIASALHYGSLRQLRFDPGELPAQDGNMDFIKSLREAPDACGDGAFSIPGLKAYLRDKGISCRVQG